LNITIKTIPHEEQRYNTAGDWWFDDAGNLEIRVSNMSNWKYEALVAYHELAEVLLCKDRGITVEEVDAFDMAWEEEHPGIAQGGGMEEPGDDPNCPCRKEHFFATTAERALSAELAVDWFEYDAAIFALPERAP
jgi:hypothetical protein